MAKNEVSASLTTLGYFALSTQIPDTTPPNVFSMALADSTPTVAASVGFTVTFDEDVTGVDVADFAIDTSGAKTVTGASITEVSGANDTWTVTVATGSGFGSLSIDLFDNDTIMDGAGNPVGGPGTGNGDYAAGAAYEVTGTDTDGDGIGDGVDPDDDNDGISDGSDAFPLDTDNDGIDNITDYDDDNDGILDVDEGVDDLDSDGLTNSLDLDSDGDGIDDGTEALLGSDPYNVLNPDDLPVAAWPAAIALRVLGAALARRRK